MAGSKRNLNDKDVLNLLSRLKDTEANYPPDMLSKRRAGFMAGIAALLSGGLAGSGTTGHVRAPLSALTPVHKLVIALEVAVLAALTAYLGVAAYNNRVYLKHLLFPGTPAAAHRALPTGFSISTEPTVPWTGTPTPTMGVTEEPTPQPGETPQPDSTNPGLHLGQTKNPPTKGPPHKKP